MLKARDALFAYVLWVLIAFPYVSFFWWVGYPQYRLTLHLDHLAVNTLAVLLPAAVGLGTFTFLRRLRALAGAIVGGFIPVLLFRAFRLDLLQLGADGIVLWNVIAGFVIGGLSGGISFETGLAITERNFTWISAVLWVVVLRISELYIAKDFRNTDWHFSQEFLTFVPVLSWSPYASKLLFRKAAGTTRRLIFWSAICAIAVEIASAICILPIGMLAMGHGGTGEAFVLLIGVNGSGIVWGAVIGYLLSRYRVRPPQPDISPTLVAEA